MNVQIPKYDMGVWENQMVSHTNRPFIKVTVPIIIRSITHKVYQDKVKGK